MFSTIYKKSLKSKKQQEIYNMKLKPNDEDHFKKFSFKENMTEIITEIADQTIQASKYQECSNISVFNGSLLDSYIIDIPDQNTLLILRKVLYVDYGITVPTCQYIVCQETYLNSQSSIHTVIFTNDSAYINFLKYVLFDDDNELTLLTCFSKRDELESLINKIIEYFNSKQSNTSKYVDLLFVKTLLNDASKSQEFEKFLYNNIPLISQKCALSTYDISQEEQTYDIIIDGEELCHDLQKMYNQMLKQKAI